MVRGPSTEEAKYRVASKRRANWLPPPRGSSCLLVLSGMAPDSHFFAVLVLENVLNPCYTLCWRFFRQGEEERQWRTGHG